MERSAIELQTWRKAMPYLELSSRLSPHMVEHGPLHIRRVLRLATQLAYLLQCDPNEIWLTRLAVILHDVATYDPRQRAVHHEGGKKLVQEWVLNRSLRLTQEQAKVVEYLVEKHRGDYDPFRIDTFSDALMVRTGLLTTIIRVADALDLDYRRSPIADSRQERLMKDLFRGSVKHHVGLRAIKGRRVVFTNALLFEVYLEDPKRLESQSGIPLEGARELVLFQVSRLVDEIQDTPLHCGVTLYPIRNSLSQCVVPPKTSRKALVLSYFDPHGIVMAALSKQNLEREGYEVTIVCNYEETRKVPDFWRETIRKYMGNYALVCILGFVIEEDMAEEALPVLRDLKALGSEVYYINHLEEGYPVIPQMIDSSINVVLGDVWSSFYGTSVDEVAVFWGRVGAICRRDPSVHLVNPSAEERNVADGIASSFFDIVQSHKEKKVATSGPTTQLISQICDNQRSSLQRKGKTSWRTRLDKAVNVEVTGRVLKVTEEIPLKSRLWYMILEDLMAEQGVEFRGGLLSFKTPYAIAKTRFEEGIKVLFMHHWEDNNPIPIKAFVQQFARIKGYEEAVWVKCHDVEEAEALISKVIQEINFE